MASSSSQPPSNANPLLAPADPLATNAAAQVLASTTPASPPNHVPAGPADASVDETPAFFPPNSPDHELACPPERPEDHEAASGDGLATHRQVLPHGSLALGQAMVNSTLAIAAGVPLPATPTLPAQVPSVLDSIPQNPAPVSANHLNIRAEEEPATPDLAAPTVPNPLAAHTGNSSISVVNVPKWQRPDTPGVATPSKDSRYFTIFHPDGTTTEQPYTITPRSKAGKAFIIDTLGPDTTDIKLQRCGFRQVARQQVTYYASPANSHLSLNIAANEAFNSSSSKTNREYRLAKGPMQFRGPVIVQSTQRLPLP